MVVLSLHGPISGPHGFQPMLLRLFEKVRSQAIHYGPWHSLRPSSKIRQWSLSRYGVGGGGKLIMIYKSQQGQMVQQQS
jgi:hypothetical protein